MRLWVLVFHTEQSLFHSTYTTKKVNRSLEFPIVLSSAIKMSTIIMYHTARKAGVCGFQYTHYKFTAQRCIKEKTLYDAHYTVTFCNRCMEPCQLYNKDFSYR